MTRNHRLSSPSDFKRVISNGRSVADSALVLYHCSQNTGGSVRFGFSVNRRIGNAVTRNRTKRILREVCRSLAGQIASGTDIVVVAKPPLAQMSHSAVVAALGAAALRAGLIRTPTSPSHIPPTEPDNQ